MSEEDPNPDFAGLLKKNEKTQHTYNTTMQAQFKKL